MPFRLATAIFVIAAALVLAVDPAMAAPAPGSGSVVATLGKAGKRGLKAQGIRLNAAKPASWSKGRMSLPVARLSVTSTAKATLGGNVTLVAGRRSARFTALELGVSRGGATISGRLGKRRVALLSSKVSVKSSRGTVKLDRRAGTVSLSGGSLALTMSGARALKKALGLKRMRGFTFGTLKASGKPKKSSASAPGVLPGSSGAQPASPQSAPAGPGQPGPDPYRDVCPVGAVSGPGAPPPSSPNPGPSQPVPVKPVGADDVVAGSVRWGFKESFRTYLRTIAGGTITARGGGATVDPATGVSTYQVTGGWLDAAPSPAKNGLSEGDGTVLYCSVPHGFWYSMSAPSVVITPGSGTARLQLTVDANQSGNYFGPRRVDFATLTLPASSATAGKTTTWADVPAKITADGAQYFSTYPAGTDLDPVTVTATTP